MLYMEHLEVIGPATADVRVSSSFSDAGLVQLRFQQLHFHQVAGAVEGRVQLIQHIP